MTYCRNSFCAVSKTKICLLSFYSHETFLGSLLRLLKNPFFLLEKSYSYLYIISIQSFLLSLYCYCLIWCVLFCGQRDMILQPTIKTPLVSGESVACSTTTSEKLLTSSILSWYQLRCDSMCTCLTSLACFSSRLNAPTEHIMRVVNWQLLPVKCGLLLHPGRSIIALAR